MKQFIPTIEQLKQKNDNMIIQFGWDGTNMRRHTKAIEIWFLDDKGKRQQFSTAIPPYESSIYVFDFKKQTEKGAATKFDGLVVISTPVNKSIYYNGELKYRITRFGLLIEPILSFIRHQYNRRITRRINRWTRLYIQRYEFRDDYQFRIYKCVEIKPILI